MSKMMHDQPSAAVPASRDRRNFLIAGAGLALAATTLGRSGAVMAKPAGQDTPNAPSDAAPVRKETLILMPDFLSTTWSLIIRADFISLTAGEIQPIHRVGCSTLVPMSGQFMPSCLDSRSGTA